eukprot:GFUD01037734.1.p1 GENE.GFUD01037734.1~~GFUD01037734.1.p1  ORF type:complete len:481 (-),score=147.99 GFUD01037734.1:170-1612(-)
MDHDEDSQFAKNESHRAKKTMNSQIKACIDPREDLRNDTVNRIRDDLSSPSSWGSESPSQLNTEVTSILSKGNPPETERSQFTHPSHFSPSIPPHEVTSRSISCPLYQKTYANTRLWSSGSPFQVPDQSAELRNHLYQAALYQNSSPFAPPRFPFLPVNRGYFPSFPSSMDSSPVRLPFPPPYTAQSFHQTGTRPVSREYRPSGQMKRRRSDEVVSSKLCEVDNVSHQRNQSHPPQPRQSSSLTTTATVQQPSSCPSSILPATSSCPPHFKKGSLIQLAGGEMKKVEDLETEDFVESADLCRDISIEHSTIVRLEHIQSTGLFLLSFTVGKRREEVTISASPHHPFFVYGHGWSSCSPSLTLARYSLSCHQLAVGDTCISLTNHTDYSSASLLMPPPHTSPETVKDFKQVRFQCLDNQSPTPKKKRPTHDYQMSSTSHLDNCPSVSVRVRMSQLAAASRLGEESYSPLSPVSVGEEGENV